MGVRVVDWENLEEGVDRSLAAVREENDYGMRLGALRTMRKLSRQAEAQLLHGRFGDKPQRWIPA